MADQIYLVTKSGSEQSENRNIDNIHTVIINADDAATAAVRLAAAVTLCNGAGHKVPAGYFDTLQLLGPPTAGVMTTAGDGIIILKRTRTEVIA